MKTIEHGPKGITLSVEYSCMDETDWLYAIGESPPNFPMPAIRQDHEFCWSLTDSEVILMDWIQGAYPSD